MAPGVEDEELSYLDPLGRPGWRIGLGSVTWTVGAVEVELTYYALEGSDFFQVFLDYEVYQGLDKL